MFWLLRWCMSQHPPYSPNLSLCDYSMIPELKKALCEETTCNKIGYFNSISV